MQERERLEAELAEARKQLEEALVREGLRHADALALDMRLRVVNHERDEALAAKERAEGERDVLKGHCRDLAKQRDDLASLFGPVCKERDEALAAKERAEGERDEAIRWRDAALADFDEMGRKMDKALALAGVLRGALESIQNGDHMGCERAYIPDDGKCPECLIEDALSLPAPEALRQQQEREAGKDALIEALTDYLSMIHDQAEEPDGHPDILRMATRALNLTPPQALREREERVGALERVVEAVRIVKAHHDKPVPIGFNWAALNRAVWDALAALDATKGGR